MKTFQDKWDKAAFTQKLSLIVLSLAVLALTIAGVLIPELGIAVLVIASAAAVLCAVFHLLENPL
jgi:hypothetical protein